MDARSGAVLSSVVSSASPGAVRSSGTTGASSCERSVSAAGPLWDRNRSFETRVSRAESSVQSIWSTSVVAEASSARAGRSLKSAA